MLAADRLEATLKQLRTAAAARVENTSLRGVAREIGMSPTGLKKFLLGTAPYSRTLRRLRNWYVRYGSQPAGEIAPQDALAALAVLTRELDPGPRRTIAEEMIDSLGRGYEDSGKLRPEWLPQLRARFEDGEKTAASAASRPSAMGKYARIPGTSDDFARRKQKEIDLEDGRAP